MKILFWIIIICGRNNTPNFHLMLKKIVEKIRETFLASDQVTKLDLHQVKSAKKKVKKGQNMFKKKFNIKLKKSAKK